MRKLPLSQLGREVTGLCSLSWAFPQAAPASPSLFLSSPVSLPQPHSASLLGHDTVLLQQAVRGYYGEGSLCQRLVSANGISSKVRF